MSTLARTSDTHPDSPFSAPRKLAGDDAIPCDSTAQTDAGAQLLCKAIRGHRGAHIADVDGEPMWWGLP